jgi:hypothetical protein
MAAVTLDTGVFIALERRQRRALALWEKRALNKTALTAPAVVIAEWWRERGRKSSRLSVSRDGIEPPTRGFSIPEPRGASEGNLARKAKRTGSL